MRLDFLSVTLETSEDASNESAALLADPLERSIAQAWQSLLRVAHVAHDSNFFQQGGHSLIGLQLIARVEAVTGVRVQFFKFSKSSTLAHLIELVKAELARQSPPALEQGASKVFVAATLDELLSDT
jgi:aryl carrier-like protein